MRSDNLQPPCLCITSNFLTNATIETFQAGHLGRHLATTSGEKCHRQDREDRQNKQKKIILKLGFPGRLYLAAFAIFAMFFQCHLTSQQFGHFSWTEGPVYRTLLHRYVITAGIAGIKSANKSGMW